MISWERELRGRPAEVRSIVGGERSSDASAVFGRCLAADEEEAEPNKTLGFALLEREWPGRIVDKLSPVSVETMDDGRVRSPTAMVFR